MRRLVAYVVAIAMLLPQPARALTLSTSFYSVKSNKVITISGVIDEYMTKSVQMQLVATHSLPGPIVVFIRSPGGSVREGQKIISMLEQERKDSKTKLVCAVLDAAHSMAFSILTHCDVRYSTQNARMVVHKVALGGDPGIRMTAKNLRHLADEMDKTDEEMAAENRAAMHLSVSDYDKYADQERSWTAVELVKMRYLNDTVSIRP